MHLRQVHPLKVPQPCRPFASTNEKSRTSISKFCSFLFLLLLVGTNSVIKHVLHRPTQTSAPTDADIRTDRRRHPYRPTQTSAPTDADICTDRCGCFKLQCAFVKVHCNSVVLTLLTVHFYSLHFRQDACLRVECVRSEAHCNHVLAGRSLELRQARVATA